MDCIAVQSNEKQMMQWFEDMTYIQLQEGEPVAELEAVKRALRECYLSAATSITDAKFAYEVKSHELLIYIRWETTPPSDIRSAKMRRDSDKKMSAKEDPNLAQNSQASFELQE